jgi:Phage lysozyme
MDPISAVITFFGGTGFRMVWGEISHWLTAAREHKREMERMRLQGELEAAQHARNQEAIKTQHSMGIEVIRVQSEARLDELGAEGWLEAVKGVSKTVGIGWVDAWNAVIRPGLINETAERLAAIIDFAFNLGAGNLKASTLRRKINAGDWHEVPAQLMRWNKAGGRVLRGLTLRRQAEADLI